jgi:hypothetical protein
MVDPVEAAIGHARGDLVSAEPELTKLSTREHGVLLGGQGGQRALAIGLGSKRGT